MSVRTANLVTYVGGVPSPGPLVAAVCPAGRTWLVRELIFVSYSTNVDRLRVFLSTPSGRVPVAAVEGVVSNLPVVITGRHLVLEPGHELQVEVTNEVFGGFAAYGSDLVGVAT